MQTWIVSKKTPLAKAHLIVDMLGPATKTLCGKLLMKQDLRSKEVDDEHCAKCLLLEQSDNG